MEVLCGAVNGTWTHWTRSECHCDWVNIITALCSMYVVMLLIAYLRWAQDRGKNSLSGKKFFGHNLRCLTSVLLLLVHLLELTDALLSIPHTHVLTVPSASLGFWASAVVLAHVLEVCGRPRLLGVSASLWALASLVRVFRLVNLLQAGATWDCLRPITAVLAAGLCCVLVVSEAWAAMIERKRASQREVPFTTTSRYKHDEAHFLSKASFYWLTPLLRAGYSCPLEAEDLGALPEGHRAKTQLERFNQIFNQMQEFTPRSSLLTFWKTCWKFMQQDFLLGGLLKLLGDLLSLVAPLGISAFVDYIGRAQDIGAGDPTYATVWQLWQNGWAVAGVVIVASIAQSTCSQASTHLVNVRAIHLNAALQAKVYTKTLRLAKFKYQMQEEDGKKADEDGTETGMATHLLAEDAVNMMSAFWVGHYTWAIPLKVALIMGLLYRYLGLAALLGSAVTILTLTPLQLVIGSKMSRNATTLSDITDERLQLVGCLISSMKLLKMLGWEQLFCAKIQKVREKEQQRLNDDSVLWAAMTLLTHVATIMVSVITLGAYGWVGQAPLTATTVFTALALFNQLTVPLFIFPVTVPIFIGAAVSGRRLAKYLSLPELNEILPKTDNKLTPNAKDLRPVHTIPEEFSCAGSVADLDGLWTPLEAMDNVFRWPDDGEEAEALEENLEDLEAESQDPSEPQGGADATVQEGVEDWALRVKDGVFSWADSSQTLTLDHVTIPKGKMTIVVGKIGSGKSSLLSAVLGEMQRISGTVNWPRNSSVAYAGQTPWLVNGTVRDNITFGRPFRPRRYGQVVNACALQPDLDILPAKDLTEVGERGINLSGGQKQRIGVARVLYSRANFVILDDPLSSLDHEVAMQLFEAGIKRLVRRGKRTVLLVTHNLNLLPHSHKVIVMEQGHIRIQGQLNDIETLDTALVSSWRETAGSDPDALVQGRTARERWQLVKLVASIGLELKQRLLQPEEEEFTETVLSRKSTRRRRPPFSEWNYLSNDLPSPMEECGVVRPVWRQNYSSRRRFMARANSLQARHIRTTPVARQLSSPLVLSGGHRRSTSRNLLRQLFSDRPKRPAPPIRAHQPVHRLASTESGFSDAKSEVDPDEYDELEVGLGGGGGEEREYGRVPRRVCLLYGTACGFSLVIAYAVASVIWQAARVLTDGWLSNWTEDPNASQNTSSYLWIYNALSLVTLVLSLASHGAGQWAGARARGQLHLQLLNHVSSCTISAIEASPAGRFLNRFSTDVAVIDKKLPTSIQRLVQFVLLCGSALAVNAIVTPWFLLAGLPVCLLYYSVQRFYRTSSRELQRLDSISRSPVVSHLVETLSGLPTIRAFCYQAKFTASFLAKVDQHTIAFLVLNSSNRWLGIVLDYMGSLIVGAAMVTALVTSRVTPGHVTASLAGLAINYTLLVPIYLNWVVKFVAECEMYMAAVERLSQILQLPTEAHQISSTVEVGATWPRDGEIRFEAVTLRYGPTSEPVFIGLNLHIQPGQKVGVCGRSGSGKSTLAVSLFRLLFSGPGRILVDGVDLSQVPPRVLRARLAVVPQDAALLPGTVRDNLDLAHTETDQALLEALDTVRLRELVEAQPNGLDGEVGSLGLSNGQRQLFCLARAVLRRASILVMDEASSSLDRDAEAFLMQAAWRAFPANTVLVIAHRLSTLLACNRIVVIERGRIAEDGTPEQLLSKQMGLFSTMLRASEDLV